MPVLPPEQILLPPRAPLSVYSFGCWARQTLVALSIASALRPSTRVPFDIDELRTGAHRQEPTDTWGQFFTRIDRGLHRYERRPIAPLRRRALRAAERWVVERQEADGSWGGIQPPWVWSIVALHALGYPLDHPVIDRALAGLDSFTIEDARGRRIEACQSPVWDTGARRARAAGRGPRADTTPSRAARAGSPAARSACAATGPFGGRTSLRAGSRSSSRTTTIPMSTTPPSSYSRCGAPALGDGGAADRGLAWSLGMQSSDGGWGAFDAENTSGLPAKLPFCDFGAVTDPPSADVTAHMVELLGVRGHPGDGRNARAGRWLLREQERDGSWFGRWGANHIYGTGAVVPALAPAALPITGVRPRSSG